MTDTPGLPRDIYLVRHGESEGNLAMHHAKSGDDSYLLEPNFVNKHSSKWRLTNKGREQARMTGEWLREEIADNGRFDFLFTSEFSRALETAALLDISEGEEWRINSYLRERDWGDIDRLTQAEREAIYARNLIDKAQHPYYWRPPNGESLIDVSARLKLWLGTITRYGKNKKILAVCHGEAIHALRIELERVSEAQFLEIEKMKSFPTPNCAIVHYTREQEDGSLADKIVRRRTIINCQPGEFTQIDRRKYSSEDLLDIVERHPVIFN
jgi:NAD+ kinase